MGDRFYELMNIVSVRNQCLERLKSLGHVMDAYPKTMTLCDVREQLLSSLEFCDGKIRELLERSDNGECEVLNIEKSINGYDKQ